MKIRHVYHEVKPGGGPAGYLYNLRQAIQEHGSRGPVCMEVSTEVALPAGTKADLIRLLRRLRTDVLSKIPRYNLVADRARRTRTLIDWLDTTFSWIGLKQAASLFEADLLVVHSTLLADRLSRLCPNLAADKLVLMTHSPTFLAHELAVGSNLGVPELELRVEPYVKALVARELRVMRSARAVLWPCRESQIGYPQWWELFQADAVNVVYAETGTIRPAPKATRQQMREAWGVPADRRIALFIGRPHPHKGFDRFVDWADLNKARGNSRWTFVHCGNSVGTPRDLSSLKLAGYVSDNGAAYLAADLVLIPNEHSYFDLGALEAISLGAKVALSPTGGHGHLIRTCASVPAIPAGSAEESWTALQTLAEEYAADDRRTNELREAWQERFSLAPFYRNLASLPDQLAEQRA